MTITFLRSQRSTKTPAIEPNSKRGNNSAATMTAVAIVDPDTGATLGTDEKETGTGAVTEVQERFAVITFTGAASPRPDPIRM